MSALPVRLFLLLSPLLLLATGCADQGEFPSLTPRPVERLSNDEPVRIAPVIAPDPALGGRAAELLAQARRGHAEFQAALPAARVGVSRAGDPGTESWIEAQQAVSRLEGARARTVIALAQLDLLSVERARQPTNAGDMEALLTAVEAAQTLFASQQAEIDQMRTRLRLG